MKNQAKEQMTPINQDQIFDIIFEKEKNKLNSMIIEFSKTERIDLFHLKLDYTYAERELNDIVFPLFQPLVNQLNILNSETKGRAYLTENIFSLFKNGYHQINKKTKTSVSAPFDFPLDIQNNEIAEYQRKYYFPRNIDIYSCPECNGDKYVQCQNPSCRGSHILDCPECSGHRTVACEECRGNGQIHCNRCDGSGEVICGSGTAQTIWRIASNKNLLSGCNGSGYLGSGHNETRCTICAGTGIVPCKQCHSSGLVKCKECRGSGQVSCCHCDATGKVECPDCYGDAKRFGKIDCPVCHTAGEIGKIEYVETTIQNNIIINTINQEQLPIKPKILEKHFKLPEPSIYYSYNNNVTININDDIISSYIKHLEEENGVSRDKYPLITKEAVSYSIIPCLKLSYQYIHTNKTHEVIIVNIWDSPEIIFVDSPDKLDINFSEAKKSISSFIGKLFNTSSNKIKSDKLNYCKLIIHSALNLNEVLPDEIKKHLLESINQIEGISSSEIKGLIKLCNRENKIDIERIKFHDNSYKTNAIKIVETLSIK